MLWGVQGIFLTLMSSTLNCPQLSSISSPPTTLIRAYIICHIKTVYFSLNVVCYLSRWLLGWSQPWQHSWCHQSLLQYANWRDLRLPQHCQGPEEELVEQQGQGPQTRLVRRDHEWWIPRECTWVFKSSACKGLWSSKWKLLNSFAYTVQLCPRWPCCQRPAQLPETSVHWSIPESDIPLQEQHCLHGPKHRQPKEGHVAPRLQRCGDPRRGQ